MSNFVKALLVVAASTAIAVPMHHDSGSAPEQGHDHEQHSWNEGAVTEYQIHSSCNETQSTQITAGLEEAMELAEHAKEHVLRWGNSSEHYQKYFGDQPRGEVIGNFDMISHADKAGILFRCDNPDGNCANEGLSVPMFFLPVTAV